MLSRIFSSAKNLNLKYIFPTPDRSTLVLRTDSFVLPYRKEYKYRYLKRTMGTIIKTATKKDLKKIQELNLKLSKKEKEEYDSLLDLDKISKDGVKHIKDKVSKKDSCVFVAIIDKKIIGYLYGKLAKTGSFGRLPTISVAEIESFFVSDEYGCKGIGKKLYNRFIKWSKSKNADKARLDVHPQNKLAIKFYKNNNFKDYYLTLEKDL
ncbi:MAG: GNAT family N-acetyltransferase [Nanoarchaeota archaeon]|nr:GNAT family N-acetyltransferase [Nanoarchaeota archaeon]